MSFLPFFKAGISTSYKDFLHWLMIIDLDKNPNGPLLWSELYRVRQEIVENLQASLFISPDVVYQVKVLGLLNFCTQLNTLEVCLTLHYIERFENNHRQVKVLLVEFECAVVDLGLVHHVVDELLHHFLRILLLVQHIQCSL